MESTPAPALDQDQDDAIARDIAALECADVDLPDEVYPTSATTFSVRPLYDRILIRQFEGKEVVRGSILIPDAVREKPARGVVLAVGEGRIMNTPSGPTLCPLVVQPGDIVLFGRYGGTDVDLDDEGRETAKILREDEVLAVITALDPPAVPVGTPPTEVDMAQDAKIVQQGRRGEGPSALTPDLGGRVIGIPGQVLRDIAPGALHRARRGDPPLFENEPGAESIPGDVKVTVEDQSQLPAAQADEDPPDEDAEQPPSSDLEPEDPEEPEELPTEEPSK